MCIFCKIIAGEIPSYKVYEDEKILAFLDIKPLSPGHTLVITKKHYQNIEEISEEELSALILAVKKIGHLLKTKLRIDGYNVSTNNDPVAGQEIPHIHFHIIPRSENDGHKPWSRCSCTDQELDDIVSKITGQNGE